MNRIVGLLLIAIGFLALLSGAIGSGKATPVDAEVAPFELAAEDRATTNLQTWGGLGAIVAGGALLVIHRRSRGKPGGAKA